jgi:hypothetical protein
MFWPNRRIDYPFRKSSQEIDMDPKDFAGTSNKRSGIRAQGLQQILLEVVTLLDWHEALHTGLVPISQYLAYCTNPLSLVALIPWTSKQQRVFHAYIFPCSSQRIHAADLRSICERLHVFVLNLLYNYVFFRETLRFILTLEAECKVDNLSFGRSGTSIFCGILNPAPVQALDLLPGDIKINWVKRITQRQIFSH